MNQKLTFPKATQVAPGMWRPPVPVSRAAQPPEGAKVVTEADAAEAALVAAAEVKEHAEPPTTQPKVDLGDFTELVASAEKVKTEICEKWSGKAGVNPHIYVKENIDPLIKRAYAGDRSEELKKALLSLTSNVVPRVHVPVVEKV